MAIVVTFRRLTAALETVGSIIAQSPTPAVILVDNDPDGTFAWSELEGSGVEIVRASENLGFGGGLELGMRRAVEVYQPADGHYFWLLDDDSPVEQGSLEEALGVLAEMPHGSVLANRGASLRRGRIIPRAARDREVEEVDLVLVDGALLPRFVVESIGYPDPILFMGFEDYEYSLRLRKAGVRLFISTAVKSSPQHMGSSSPWRCYYQSRNHTYTALKMRSFWLLKGALERTAKQIVAAAINRRSQWRQCVRFRIMGTVDAFRGRMGRTIDPTQQS